MNINILKTIFFVPNPKNNSMQKDAKSNEETIFNAKNELNFTTVLTLYVAKYDEYEKRKKRNEHANS